MLLNAVSGSGPFAAPRSEMLKEVLVRAASNRWGNDREDVAQRKIWGPWLKDLFGDSPQPPIVQVEGEIVIVKLRATEPPRSTPLGARQIPITVRTITEQLAEELFGKDFVQKTPPEIEPRGDDCPPGTPIDPTPAVEGVGSARTASAPIDTAAARVAKRPSPPATGNRAAGGDPRPASPKPNTSAAGPQRGERAGQPAYQATPALPASVASDTAAIWPPQVNALGMIGQDEIARELDNQARKAKGWGERFLDKLFVGPAGVGKTTLARRIAEQLLGLEPIIFNGADLRRPEMIIDRLASSIRCRTIQAARSGSTLA